MDDEIASPKRAVVVFNRYLTRGGEDEVFESESELLRSRGWDVVPVTDTTRIPHGVAESVRFGADTLWSKSWHANVRGLVRRLRPSIVHVHNVFPMMSPAVLYAARAEGAGIVHTLHNYRLVCPNALCYRDERPCEDCVGRSTPWPGVVHSCYRESRAHTSAVAAMLALHRGIRTWHTQVDTFVALSEFARRVFIRGGLPARKIVVKPNYVDPDPGVSIAGDGYCLFVGRLAQYKGILTLLGAWTHLSGIPLKVIGDPTTSEEASKVAALGPVRGVEFLGRTSREEVASLLRGARLLVFPSECYESFPLAIVEAFACGVPVLASRLGAMAEVVADGRTGLHFTPGDANDLAAKVRWAWDHPAELQAMRLKARAEYEARYTADRNYDMLVAIYRRALRERRAPMLGPGRFPAG